MTPLPPVTPPPLPPVAAAPPQPVVRRRGRGLWWTLASIVVGLAVVFCVWFARPLTPVRYVQLPPGATLVDELGTAYTVLLRQELDVISNYRGDFEPVEGATFLEYVVQVDQFRPEVLSNEQLNMCTFQLVGADGELWNDTDIFIPDVHTFCPRDAVGTSFQVHAIFQVPTDRVPGLLGLVPERLGMTPHWGTEQVFSQPA